MQQDKRKSEKPAPDNLSKFLNEAQLQELHNVEKFGWELLFLRRPLFQETTAVVVDSHGNIMGILRDDGTIDTKAEIITRK